jgi:hypothetical protein
VKCWIKIGATVTLISLLSVNIGLQTALWFGAPTRPRGIASQQATPTEGDKKAADHPKSDDSNSVALIIAVLGAGGSILTLFVIGYQTHIFHGQRRIMGQQTDILARQLNIQGPFVEYSIYKLQLWGADIARGVVGDWKISLELKNSGKDVATNIAYWKGEVFLPKSANNPILSDDSGEYFGRTIFRASGTEPGRFSMSPGATTETDQITLTPLQLQLLHRGDVRMFVWLVATYGSRLQPQDWFAEIAVNLEFVLNTDPIALTAAIDPTKIGQAVSGLMAFKVRVAGYRYREDRRKQRQEGEGHQTQPPPQPFLFGPLWLPRPRP